MSNNNNTSCNQSWWRANFEEGDEWNRYVRQNTQYDAMICGLENNRAEGDEDEDEDGDDEEEG